MAKRHARFKKFCMILTHVSGQPAACVGNGKIKLSKPAHGVSAKQVANLFLANTTSHIFCPVHPSCLSRLSNVCKLLSSHRIELGTFDVPMKRWTYMHSSMNDAHMVLHFFRQSAETVVTLTAPAPRSSLLGGLSASWYSVSSSHHHPLTASSVQRLFGSLNAVMLIRVAPSRQVHCDRFLFVDMSDDNNLEMFDVGTPDRDLRRQAHPEERDHDMFGAAAAETIREEATGDEAESFGNTRPHELEEMFPEQDGDEDVEGEAGTGYQPDVSGTGLASDDPVTANEMRTAIRHSWGSTHVDGKTPEEQYDKLPVNRKADPIFDPTGHALCIGTHQDLNTFLLLVPNEVLEHERPDSDSVPKVSGNTSHPRLHFLALVVCIARAVKTSITMELESSTNRAAYEAALVFAALHEAGMRKPPAVSLAKHSAAGRPNMTVLHFVFGRPMPDTEQYLWLMLYVRSTPTLVTSVIKAVAQECDRVVVRMLRVRDLSLADLIHPLAVFNVVASLAVDCKDLNAFVQVLSYRPDDRVLVLPQLRILTLRSTSAGGGARANATLSVQELAKCLARRVGITQLPIRDRVHFPEIHVKNLVVHDTVVVDPREDGYDQMINIHLELLTVPYLIICVSCLKHICKIVFSYESRA
ncbi:hypothetical protein PENSPDRAFT_672363 [Peniophora sp. CONT]|nr:hypothetical protein PENSPDRAFT_672363 [Peniophora sp. CONT]